MSCGLCHRPLCAAACLTSRVPWLVTQHLFDGLPVSATEQLIIERLLCLLLICLLCHCVQRPASHPGLHRQACSTVQGQPQGAPRQSSSTNPCIDQLLLQQVEPKTSDVIACQLSATSDIPGCMPSRKTGGQRVWHQPPAAMQAAAACKASHCAVGAAKMSVLQPVLRLLLREAAGVPQLPCSPSCCCELC